MSRVVCETWEFVKAYPRRIWAGSALFAHVVKSLLKAEPKGEVLD